MGDGSEEEAISNKMRREVWARFPEKQKYDDVMVALLLGIVVAVMLLKFLH